MNRIALREWRFGKEKSVLTLLIVCLIMPGCGSRTAPKIVNMPPLDAYATSGGKIKHFTPLPGLEHDSSNSILLTAAGLSNIKGSTARSAIVTFQSSTGNNLVNCLVVGTHVLVILEDFTAEAFGWVNPSAGPGSSVVIQGPPYNGKPFLLTKPGQAFLYEDSQQYIQLDPNSQTALVGGKRIALSHPVLWQEGKHPLSGDHVILLSDLLRLLQERGKQMGSGMPVRNVKIIYDLRDYHR